MEDSKFKYPEEYDDVKIPGYPVGSDITVMNVYYQRMEKDEETNKWRDDSITIIFKDNKTGEKKVAYYTDPTYTWYLLKPQYQLSYNAAFVDRNKVDPIHCKYREVKKSIADCTGNSDIYKENARSGNYQLNTTFFAHPRAFAADSNILNYTRSVFAEKYMNEVTPISIAFFDIETDISEQIGDDIEIGTNPVNAISLFFTDDKTMYNFVLRNPKNPQIEVLENNIKNNPDKYLKKVQDFIFYDLGSKEKAKKYGVDNINLKVGFYTDEAEMLCAFFDLMKDLCPDFAVAYNISFDLPSLIKRLEILGFDPKDVICDSDMPEKFCEYIVDMKNKNYLEERCDISQIASRVTYLDQMVIYASRRKGQAAVESNKLDFIGQHECGVRKLDYHEITTDIGKFPYLDFETFWLYNIIDVIVQVCIEAQTEDLKYVFNNVIEMNTPYQKIFRQTNYLATKGMDFYKHHEGFIMGNNVNKFGEKPDQKFPGAFVARPDKLSDLNKVKVYDIPINKYNNANDFDYKRLYPSLLQEFNMSTNTQVGLLEIKDPPYKDKDNLRIGPGGTFVENLASYNYIEFCKRWLHLADVEDMITDIKEYIKVAKPKKKEVISMHDTSKPITLKRPMPEWVKQEVDKIRKGIELK